MHRPTAVAHVTLKPRTSFASSEKWRMASLTSVEYGSHWKSKCTWWNRVVFLLSPVRKYDQVIMLLTRRTLLSFNISLELQASHLQTRCRRICRPEARNFVCKLEEIINCFFAMRGIEIALKIANKATKLNYIPLWPCPWVWEIGMRHHHHSQSKHSQEGIEMTTWKNGFLIRSMSDKNYLLQVCRLTAVAHVGPKPGTSFVRLEKGHVAALTCVEYGSCWNSRCRGLNWTVFPWFLEHRIGTTRLRSAELPPQHM